jgi:hypothetical protein
LATRGVCVPDDVAGRDLLSSWLLRVKAVHTRTHINEYGVWINHPTKHTVIVQHLTAPQENGRSVASGTPSPVTAQRDHLQAVNRS